MRKVREEGFDELAGSPGIRPAPCLDRYKWVLVEEVDRLDRK
jgi:predicted DNA-binding protein (MmcQ/YjbR family)